jgi:hypothetical protein
MVSSFGGIPAQTLWVGLCPPGGSVVGGGGHPERRKSGDPRVTFRQLLPFPVGPTRWGP